MGARSVVGSLPVVVPRRGPQERRPFGEVRDDDVEHTLRIEGNPPYSVTRR